MNKKIDINIGVVSFVIAILDFISFFTAKYFSAGSNLPSDVVFFLAIVALIFSVIGLGGNRKSKIFAGLVLLFYVVTYIRVLFGVGAALGEGWH